LAVSKVTRWWALWRRAVKGGGVETGLIRGNEGLGLLRVATDDGSTTVF
jgi:hypothetical protein